MFINGDFSKIDVGTVDAIITDPPYAREYWYLYKNLGDLAERCLKDQGWLLAIVPQYGLVETISMVSRPNLRQWWCSAMVMPEPPHARMRLKGMIVKWKPICVWLKGNWTGKLGYRPDMFLNNPPEQNQHPQGWEQSIDWARYCVANFSREGDTVLDPMMGVGTIGIACRELNRNFIGIEIDKKTCEIAAAVAQR